MGTDNQVAIKIITDSMSKNNLNVIVNELETMVRLEHENMISVIESGKGTYVKQNG